LTDFRVKLRVFCVNPALDPRANSVDAQASEYPTAVRWQIVVMLMALCSISHINRASMAVAGTDRIMDQYGIDPVKMGWVYSAFLLAYSICMIPGGVLIDRAGPRRALMLVGFSSAILGAVTGATGWFVASGVALIPVMLVVRGTMGALSAPLHPAAARAIGNWFPFPERSFANGVVTAAAIFGVAVSYPGFSALIKVFGWQGAFVVCGIITGLLACGWAYYVRDWPSEHPGVNEAEKRLIQGGGNAEAAHGDARSPILSWLELLQNPNLILVTLSYAAVGYFQYLFVYWMAYYFEKVLKLGPDASKYYAGFLQIALAAGMPLGGWLSGKLSGFIGVRKGRSFVSGGGMVLSATLLGFGVLAREPFWIVAWFALAHLAIGAAEGPIWATAVDIGGNKGGTAAAICNTGGNIGGMIAPVLTPWVGQTFGWPAGIGLGGAFCFFGAMCWLWINPRASDERAP
jgi:ACS family D-galactonate transporter-like MFS transporter